MKTFRLQESKTTLLKRLLNNGNITEEQFHIADDFFKKHTSFEKEIDWNRGLKITWDDLKAVIYKERNSESKTRKKIRKGLEGFEEGKDYLVLEETDSYTAYQPFTWEASRMIASHYVEPTEGYNETLDAEWCTAYQKDRDYWDSHNEQEAFIYLCGESIPTKKVAISISEEDFDANDNEFLYFTGSLNYNIWDFNDYNDTIGEDELLGIISNLDNLIEKAYKNWKNYRKELNKQALLSKLTLNLETSRYDYDGSLTPKLLTDFVSEDKDGFTIDFGEVTGNFLCSFLGLTSLKGAPQIVGHNFDCSRNNLPSLEGAPQIVGGDFNCSINKLPSLEGAPQEVGGNFVCHLNQLTSLKGAPQKVGGDFDCSYNELTSLEGAPKTVGRDFKCYNNELTSLEGAPQEVGESFNCYFNNLIFLKGAPQKVGRNFLCESNNLTSLEGAPQTVGRNFRCSYNELTSLKGAPQTVGGWFNCSFNELTSLEGAPQEVGDYFDCRYNPNLHFLEGIGEVKGDIYKDF